MNQQIHLKRTAALALSFVLLLGSLAGCAGKQAENTESETVANTYAPPVNEDGYIVVTMPITLTGGNTAEELEAEHKAAIANMSEEEIKQLFYSYVTANDDGSFNYILTTEQYPKFRAGLYWLGCLHNPYTAEISQDYAAFVTEADYTDIDENGIPWGVTVSVDAETYYSMELWYSVQATVLPAVCLGRYQVTCGIPGDEWAVHVTVKDAETGQVISENDFPTRDE